VANEEFPALCNTASSAPRHDAGAATPPSTRSLREIAASYAQPDGRRAAMQLLNTLLPFLGIMAALLYGLAHGMWPALILVLPAAALVVRLFTLQHDCGHGSFFKSRRLNDLVGRLLGAVTLMPYRSWRADHAVHHAGSGNLARRGIGDVSTWTVSEYLSRSSWRRFLYRLYRHPLVLFGVGPAYMLLIRYRIPVSNPLRDWRGWSSIIGTNACVAIVAVTLALLLGPGVVAMTWGPVLLLAMTIGVWFFYVQHQFEDTYWETDTRWSFHDAALAGSSFYDLPRILHWMTGYIGFHHIHHVASRVPNYRLRACFEQNPEFQNVRRLTLWNSVKCAGLALWDEEKRRLVSFRQARQERRRDLQRS
jgi:omega-6 fatty acid desaturase (delta-12 desaturase)